MRRLCAVAVVGVVTGLSCGQALAYDWPVVDFSAPGDTYDPATLGTYGDQEGTTVLEYPGDPVAGKGVALTVGIGAADGRGVLPLAEGPYCIGSGGVFPIVGANPYRRSAPRKNGVWARVRWSWVGCTNTTTWRVADGVTTYTVSRLKRVYRPAVYRTIWEDQSNGDAYFNTCLTADYISSIRQEGGRKYCKVLVREKVDRTTYRLTQRTTITKVYPAYVTP